MLDQLSYKETIEEQQKQESLAILHYRTPTVSLIYVLSYISTCEK